MNPTEKFLMLAVASPLATFTSYEILPVQNNHVIDFIDFQVSFLIFVFGARSSCVLLFFFRIPLSVAWSMYGKELFNDFATALRARRRKESAYFFNEQ